MAVDWDSLVLKPLMGIYGEAVPANYVSAGGAAFTISGVFDVAYRDVEAISGGGGASDMSPVLGVRLSDYPVGVTPGVNDLVTVASVATRYVVREVHPDGHGWAKLLLNEAP